MCLNRVMARQLDSDDDFGALVGFLKRRCDEPANWIALAHNELFSLQVDKRSLNRITIMAAFARDRVAILEQVRALFVTMAGERGYTIQKGVLVKLSR